MSAPSRGLTMGTAVPVAPQTSGMPPLCWPLRRDCSVSRQASNGSISPSWAWRGWPGWPRHTGSARGPGRPIA